MREYSNFCTISNFEYWNTWKKPLLSEKYIARKIIRVHENINYDWENAVFFNEVSFFWHKNPIPIEFYLHE